MKSDIIADKQMVATTFEETDDLQLPDEVAAVPRGGEASQRQKTGFWFVLSGFLMLIAWASVRCYFYVLGDYRSERKFIYHSWTIRLNEICLLCFLIGFVIVGQSALESKRLTRYGIGAVAMLTIPLIPVAFAVCAAYWSFFMSL